MHVVMLARSCQCIGTCWGLQAHCHINVCWRCFGAWYTGALVRLQGNGAGGLDEFPSSVC